jgi:hypothetical protein
MLFIQQRLHHLLNARPLLWRQSAVLGDEIREKWMEYFGELRYFC